MTLDEAIKHAEEVAEEQENKAKVLNGDFYQSRRNTCFECAKEHRQLAEWLKELKKLKEKAKPQIVRYIDDERFEDDADAYCPNCDELLIDYWYCGYCPCCGQALEW